MEGTAVLTSPSAAGPFDATHHRKQILFSSPVSHVEGDRGEVKVKVKFILEDATKAQRGEQKYSSTLSLTSALDGVGGQRHAPAALPPVKPRYPLYRRLGRPQGRSGWMRKISLPPRFDHRTVQLLASRYTD